MFHNNLKLNNRQIIMQYDALFIFSLVVSAILIAPQPILGYLGLIFCFLLSSLGAAKGIWSISSCVSGTSIKSPNVGLKSILGTVVCEANFLSGIITCVMAYGSLSKTSEVPAHILYFCSSLFVGMCSYYSSVSTGLICAVISMMDGKDPSIFYKVVVLEVIPASVGLIGFILGIVMNSKADALL